ncbi:MAG: glutamine synthetase [Linnemannia gamsii]|nr:MAG: glutamine synthetase [Linnemannia gamsii]
MMHTSFPSSNSQQPPAPINTSTSSHPAAAVSQAAIEEIKTLLENDVRIKVAGIDLDGILRGKIMAKTKFLSVLESGFGFCSIVFGWDMHDKTYPEELSVSNAANGYKDMIAIPDLSTFRRIPWENNIPFFLLSFFDPKTRAPLAVCPRGVLKRVTDELASHGWEAMCGIELEFYNFKETPDTMAAKGYTNPEALTPGMFGYSLLRPSLHQDYFYDIFDQCRDFGVNIEGFHTETGPGVYEAALAYDSATKMADMANLFKLSVKQLGLQRGIMPTFMAKPYADQPGSSGHLHFSIRDISTKTNLFAASSSGAGTASGPASSSIPFGQQLHSPTSDGEESTGAAAASLDAALNRPDWETTVEGVQEMSQMMKYFTAGLLTALPSIMCILAPNINSYKRLVENYWAPVTISWGIESRVSAIRVIGPPQCEPKGTRLEMRVGGADINPHLAIAACLAAGMYGIKKRLAMPVEPTAVEIGGEGPIRGERLPKSLKDSAMKMLEKGSIAREVLGDEFVEHYGATRLNEHRLWENAVTNWETKRYFELV